MTSTTFIDKQTIIQADWLNDVNTAVYTTVPAQSNASGVAYTPAGTGAVTTTVQTKLRQYVSIFDFMSAAQIADVQANTSTLDLSSTIQTALNGIVASGKFTHIVFPVGTYRFDSGLVINITFMAIDFSGATLNFVNMTSGIALDITGADGSSPYTNGKVQLLNALVTGPGAAVTTVFGIRFYNDVEAGPSHISLVNVSTMNFYVGHNIYSDAYCIDFFNCDIGACGTGTTQASSGSNFGERIAYFGSTLFNCTVTAVDMQNASGEFVFSQCSFDYNPRHFYINGGRVNLSGCHIEGATYAAEPIYIGSANGGTFVMQGGWMLCTGSNTSSIVSVNTTANKGGGASFRDVSMNNLGSATYFATGTGRCTVSNTFSYDTRQNPLLLSAAGNLLVDGGFEGSVVADAFISADTVAITSRVTGTNIALTNSSTYARTGTQSLKAAKTYGAGTACAFVILGALQDKSSASNKKLYYKKPGSETGTVFVSFGYANIQSSPTTGVPYVYKELDSGTTTITFTSSAVDWTVLQSAEPILTAPSWATHSVIVVNMANFVGPGNLYFDDAEITAL